MLPQLLSGCLILSRGLRPDRAAYERKRASISPR